MRGGSYGFSHGLVLHAFSPLQIAADSENNILGFRVAAVPEPATLGLLAVGGLALLVAVAPDRIDSGSWA